jgi:hypothetical protein
MPNQSGTYNPLPGIAAVQCIGGVNITGVQNASTDIFSFASVAGVSPGVYQPVIWYFMQINWGATVPPSAQVTLRVGAGSTFFSTNIYTTYVTASSSVPYSGMLVGPASDVSYRPPGVTLNLSLALGAGTNVTVVNSASFAWSVLTRISD